MHIQQINPAIVQASNIVSPVKTSVTQPLPLIPQDEFSFGAMGRRGFLTLSVGACLSAIAQGCTPKSEENPDSSGGTQFEGHRSDDFPKNSGTPRKSNTKPPKTYPAGADGSNPQPVTPAPQRN